MVRTRRKKGQGFGSNYEGLLDEIVNIVKLVKTLKFLVR